MIVWLSLCLINIVIGIVFDVTGGVAWPNLGLTFVFGVMALAEGVNL